MGSIAAAQASGIAASAIGSTATRIHVFAPSTIGMFRQILGTFFTLGAVVIAACTANAAIHNNAEPPMGAIMLKCAGIALALFAAYMAFAGTSTFIISLGLSHTVAKLAACLSSAYVLYFSFSEP